jgi:GT2 family glycosyltransferase
VKFVRSARAAIVIPVHNTGEHLWRSLGVLRRMTLPEASIVVVDDGSADGTWERLAGLDDMESIRADGTLWWSGAVDVGARRAIENGAEVVILWNDDNLDASPDVVSQLAAVALEHSCCVSPVVVDFPIAAQPRIAQAGGIVRWREGGLRLRRVGEAYEARDSFESCDWLSGQALAFPAAVFARVGGFDRRRFPQYRGDSDFTLRASKAGTPSRVLLSCWVANETTRTGLAFHRRPEIRDFFRGLVSRRSNYELRSTVTFYWRHAPRMTFAPSLALFYVKYVYAFLKTWLLHSRA